MAISTIAHVRKYRGKEIKKIIDSKLEMQMNKAARFIRTETRKLINRKNPTGLRPSKPGEPPKRFTGELFKGLVVNVRRGSGMMVDTTRRDELTIQVGMEAGSPAEAYVKRLQFGFFGTDSLGRNVHQEPRPFADVVVKKKRRKILDIVLSGPAVLRKRVK